MQTAHLGYKPYCPRSVERWWEAKLTCRKPLQQTNLQPVLHLARILMTACIQNNESDLVTPMHKFIKVAVKLP
jgi:hypothetical protein